MERLHPQRQTNYYCQRRKGHKNDILKGCLSNIPVGCCTSVQERLHREMKKILTSNRIGSELAYSKFSRFFFKNNAKKSGKIWSPIMEEVSNAKSNAMQNSSEAKPTYVETFGIRQKDPAQSCQERQCSEEVPSKTPLVAVTVEQINIILDEIKSEIEGNCEISDNQEDNDHTYDSGPLTHNDKSAEQILQMLQYGLILFKVMLILQKSQEMKSFNFSKLPFMSRALLHARSLIETSERRSDINSQVSSFGYDVEPVPGDGNCFFHAVSFQLLKLLKGENGQSIQNGLCALGISLEQSLATNAEVLRQRVVDEWQGPFIDEYQQFLIDSEMDVYMEAEKFRRSGEFCRPLGDGMPLAMANVLQLPIVLITSAQNMPIVTVTPRSILFETSIILAYTQGGAAHYDALTERSPVNIPGSDTQNQTENTEESTEIECTTNGKGSEPGECHKYCK